MVDDQEAKLSASLAVCRTDLCTVAVSELHGVTSTKHDNSIKVSATPRFSLFSNTACKLHELVALWQADTLAAK